MKLNAKLPGNPFLPVMVAGVIALAVSGCGEEPRPKSAAKAAPPSAPAAPQTETMAVPVKPAVESEQAAADQALAAKVKSALAAAGINIHRIDIVAKNGAVTLFGTTDSSKMRETAVKTAAAVAGVKSVDSKLVAIAGS